MLAAALVGFSLLLLMLSFGDEFLLFDSFFSLISDEVVPIDSCNWVECFLLSLFGDDSDIADAKSILGLEVMGFMVVVVVVES